MSLQYYTGYQPIRQFDFSKRSPQTKSSKSNASVPLTFREFIALVNPKYRFYRHLEKLIAVLQRVADGELKRLMVFMPPRHGKCMAQGSPVLLADGRMVSIENVCPSDMVISLDSCYNKTVSTVLSTTENGEKPVLKITLQSGRYIVCTENHPLLTVLGWREAGGLKIGDSIAALRQLPMPEGEPLPFGFAALMGYITGDGSYAKGNPIVTASEQETVEHLQRIADAHGWKLTRDGKYGYHIRKANHGRHDGSSATERLRTYMTPAKSGQKRVPECMFQANRDDLCAFLAAYFNCDGTVNGKREGVAEYYSTSEGLLRDVQHLLMRLGVYSTLRLKKGRYKGDVHISWRLIVSGQDLVTMGDALPVIGVRGRKLREVVEKCRGKVHYPEYESIPPGWQDLRTTRGKKGGGLRKALGLRIDKTYKRGTARHLVKSVADFENNETLHRVCSPDVMWERIVNIESLGDLPTYDIEVKDTHNFVVDSTIVHNSETVSRLFTAYYLYRHPERWVGINSYADALATTLSRNARENYQSIGGNLNPSAASMHHWETDGGGGLWAAGVGGPITGKGFHLGVIDDPVKNAEEASSITIRQRHVEWYKSTFSTREEPDAAIVVVQTRWNDADLSGWLLSEETTEDEEDDDLAEHWHIVSMPAIKEHTEKKFPNTCTVEGDDRQIGEPLCKERYDADKLQRIKRRVGTYYWNALYRQDPAPDEGDIFKRHWWRYWKPKGIKLPPVLIQLVDGSFIEIEAADLPDQFDEEIQSWDCAFKDTKTSDFVAGQVWARNDADRYLLDYYKDRASIIGTMAEIERFSGKWPQSHAKLVEDKANGPAVIQLLSSKVYGLIAVDPKGGKIARAHASSPVVESGNVYLPHPLIHKWVNGFIDTCAGFPNVANDDDVDSFTQAMIRWQGFTPSMPLIQGKAKVR